MYENRAGKSTTSNFSLDFNENNNDLSKSMIAESTKRKIKDNYSKNPMHILSKNEQLARTNIEANKNKNKSTRVTSIFSSNQIKTTVQPNKTWKCVIPPKIYNENCEILKGAAKEYKNTGKKNFNHVIENNRVFYY